MATFVFETNAAGALITAGNFTGTPTRSGGAAIRVEADVALEPHVLQTALTHALEAFRLRRSGQVVGRDRHLFTEDLGA